MSIIAFSSAIGPVPISCVLTEKHISEIGISEIPIETGAKISDHAYVMPKKVSLDVADDNAAATFNALVQFQESRVPFTLVTGLSVYKNMLVKTLDADRDASFSRVLRCKADLQEVIIVETAYTQSQEGQGGPGRAGTPSKGKSGDAATADRASGTVQRGDAPAKAATAQDSTILYKTLWGD